MKGLLLSAAVVFVLSCGAGPLKVSSKNVGSSADNLGTITDTNLHYTFKKPLNVRRAGDLINSIYFQGDCIHFSFTLNRIIPKEKISVTYSGPGGVASMPAERLEVRRDTLLGMPAGTIVYGFSLVGSVLERFHKQELGAPAPADGYCCKDIPLEITLEIDDKTGPVKESMSGAFSIRYE